MKTLLPLALLCAACGLYEARPTPPICELPLDDGGCDGWLFPDSDEALLGLPDGGWITVTGSSGFFTPHGAHFLQGDAGAERCCGPVQLGTYEELFLDALADNGWPRGAMARALPQVTAYAASDMIPCLGASCLGLDTEESPTTDRIDLDVNPPNDGCGPEGIYVHELGHALRHQLIGDGDSTHKDLSIWRAVERVAGPYCAGGVISGGL